MERAMKKEKKMFSLYFRCFQDLRRFCPGVFLASGCYAAMKAAAPYAAIYCSARLLDEMAGGQSREGLLFWAAAGRTCGGWAGAMESGATPLEKDKRTYVWHKEAVSLYGKSADDGFLRIR